MKLGEHVMYESALACPQSHNGHLVFSWEEVVFILSDEMRILLKPSLPLFPYGLCLFKRDFGVVLTAVSHHPSPIFQASLLSGAFATGRDPLNDCSFSGLLHAVLLVTKQAYPSPGS